MTMGQRILAARQEAGLSQRQLAGEEITRNMLSSLEHDTANPSIATLRYLSEKLHKPVSYFLGEDVPTVAGWQTLASAREDYDSGEYRRCLERLSAQTPGPVLEREWGLLEILALLHLAEQAILENRLPYARELLTRISWEHPYFTPELRRKAHILAAKCPEKSMQLPDLVSRIEPDDEVLLLRAEAALMDGRTDEALCCLNAAGDRDSVRWHYLMGEARFARREFREAARCWHKAEDRMDLRQKLEACYRELEDYKMAYYYAKKQV